MRLSTIGIKYIHSTAYDKRRKSPKTLLHFDITVNIGVFFYKKRTIYDSDLESRRLKYYKVVSWSTSWLVAHPSIFKLFMTGKFDALCILTFDQKGPKLNSRPVYCSRFMVYETIENGWANIVYTVAIIISLESNERLYLAS